MTLRVVTDYVGEIERLRAELARLTTERDSDRGRWHARLASAHGREEKFRAALADTPENRDYLFGRGCADMETAGLALRALRERAGIE